MQSSSRDQTFEQAVDTTLQHFYEARPTEARWLGLHKYDGLIEDASPAAIENRSRQIDSDIQALEAFSAATLSSEQRFDRDLLIGQLAFERFQVDEMKEPERNPMIYADPIDLSLYITRSYGPINERARAMAAQAEQIPALLAQARANLQPVLPRSILETAVDVFRGTASFIREEIPVALREAGATVDVSSQLSNAASAVSSFVAFLEEALERADDNFAIGADRFQTMLRLGEMVDIPLDRLLEIGEENLERDLEAAREAAAKIDPNRTLQEVSDLLGADHPPAGELVSSTAALLEELRSFLIERNVLTVPSDVRCLVEPTPSFLRWADAMMDAAGPFETVAQESYYYVTPPEDDWPPEQQEEWMTSFARSSLPGISIHEAYPGHYIHFLHIANASSPVRKSVMSYSFIEGWAHYSEQMMLDIGYGDGDPRLRLAQVKEALLRDCRFVAAIKMHTQGMSVDEATRLFMEKGFREEKPSRQEAVRGTFDPGYLNYTLGKLMMLKLRDDYRRERGAEFSLRDFHDRALALGAPPFALARRALLHDDIDAVL